jgi:hypothetical protein
MVIELANEVKKVLAVLGKVHPNDKKLVGRLKALLNILH